MAGRETVPKQRRRRRRKTEVVVRRKRTQACNRAGGREGEGEREGGGFEKASMGVGGGKRGERWL